MKRSLLLLFALVSLTQLWAQTGTFNITDFGAVADGRTLNTVAIQKAIDACYEHGGGRVYVPAGTFLTGTISLKSKVNLFLDGGARLKGSGELKDYRNYTLEGYGTLQYGILYTENAEDVSITGQGAIDGNDSAYFEWDKAKKIDAGGVQYTRQKEDYRKVESGIGDGPVVPKDRPRQMVIFSNCKNVTVRDIKLLNSPFWTLHLADCDAVVVSGAKVWSNMLVPNADGIDVTSSRNVTISDCDVRAGDDAIVVTGFAHHFELPGYKNLRHVSENIVVTNCNLQSSSCGLRIGWQDQNTVRNVQVSNVNITNSTRGIGIFLRDEGSLENLSFSNMYIETRLRTGDWWGNGEPIHISAIRGKEGVPLGKIRNVHFSNLVCKGENGMLVYGTAESVIEDLTFSGITFELVDSRLNPVAGGNVDLRGVRPGVKELFQRDIPGLLLQQVRNVTVQDFTLRWSGTRMPYFTHGLEAVQVRNLRVRQFNGGPSPASRGAARISLQGVEGFATDDASGVVRVKQVGEQAKM